MIGLERDLSRLPRRALEADRKLHPDAEQPSGLSLLKPDGRAGQIHARKRCEGQGVAPDAGTVRALVVAGIAAALPAARDERITGTRIRA
jgi:hypothetical protein